MSRSRTPPVAVWGHVRCAHRPYRRLVLFSCCSRNCRPSARPSVGRRLREFTAEASEQLDLVSHVRSLLKQRECRRPRIPTGRNRTRATPHAGLRRPARVANAPCRRNIQRHRDLLVAQLRPSVEEQNLALFADERPERSGDPRGHKRGTQSLVGKRWVLAELRLSAQSRVEVEQVLFGPPVITQQIGRDAVQPGAQRAADRIETGSPAKGRRKGLSCEVVG